VEGRISVAAAVPQRDHDRRLARLSGIAGIVGLGVTPLLVAVYGLAVAMSNEFVLFGGAALIGMLMVVGGFVGVILGFHTRRQGGWGLVGMVTGSVALALSGLSAALLVLMVVAS
jgi:hypothetical protein